MAKEFEGMLGDSSPIVANEAAVSQPTEVSISSRSQADNGLRRSGGDKQAAVVPQVRAREEVRILQLRLRDAGFDPGPFDGVMGPKTKFALEQFEASQRSRKIKTNLTPTSMGGHY
jgi:peptidoglycan hydrolase-like protein with peptidoglycan-binding domain